VKLHDDPDGRTATLLSANTELPGDHGNLFSSYEHIFSQVYVLGEPLEKWLRKAPARMLRDGSFALAHLTRGELPGGRHTPVFGVARGARVPWPRGGTMAPLARLPFPVVAKRQSPSDD